MECGFFVSLTLPLFTGKAQTRFPFFRKFKEIADLFRTPSQ